MARAHPGRLAPILLLVLAASACGDSGTEPAGAVSLERVSGDAQTGTVGTPLPQPVVVRARDAGGNPVVGASVRFSVAGGGGSTNASLAVTDADGRASADWTLGPRTGTAQRLRAELVEGGAGAVEFQATVTAGPPARLEKVAGDQQRAQRLAVLREALAVRVADAFGNAVAGVAVTFAVTSGGGSVEPQAAETDEQGVASARWTLGAELGEQDVNATVQAIPAAGFSATALDLPYVAETVASVILGERSAPPPSLGAPEADPTAPFVTVAGSEVVVPGGGGLFRLTADREFNVVYVFVRGREGYWELDVGAAQGSSGVTSADLVLVFDEVLGDFGDVNHELQFAVGTGGGPGPRVSHVVDVHLVRTGPIQVTVWWDVPSDVDLYVVEPSGETIWFENPTSQTGGVLELDANGGCIGEDVRNESITWPETRPPNGTYVVRLNLWSSCTHERTSWLVTVRAQGQPTRTYRGVFTGDGDGGDEGSGEFVTTFTF